ncbi:carbohydrate ABC transporter permease [Defluviitalea raffinosedens]|uniref:ABC transporter permease subunit n=1 Tax=Defluviitalea raffinosedens TaxID=1450156 RepID=A0A7C8HFA4_9FIRM|nr:carbohydrate ABC transporter permease [Defluviitalea raffinosedens]KAE9635454.1 ABC transporter permease subunit [Defluviitalea raffinosedens]MBM7684361.1 multiple sugar transport system permease protein [Defluviitalea raffinosedens]HHW67638.1 carbohydrate ABC transporter permease [Candidatus Epulonipiscium sp.]
MKKENIYTYLVHLVLIIGAIIMIVPFIWMALTSFKTISEATQMNPFVIFPSKWRLDAFKSVIRKMNFLRLYWNTLVLIAGRVICAVLTATMAGYALGRLKFPGKDLAFGIVLFQMMVPAQIFIIPQYLMVSKMGLLNTSFALIFPGLVTAFGTFLLRQAYMGLPKDLEEAAILDGCNIGQIFLHVMLPLTKSSMVALGIFTALFAFKDLMWPLVVNTEQTTMPLSAALAKLQGQFVTNFPELMAASLLACIPMIIIYILFQRQFVEGIATSGSKL